MNNFFTNLNTYFIAHPYLFPIIGIWDLTWRGFALWHASQNKQRNWFIVLMVVNSVGILPIIYLKFFQKKLKIKK